MRARHAKEARIHVQPQMIVDVSAATLAVHVRVAVAPETTPRVRRARSARPTAAQQLRCVGSIRCGSAAQSRQGRQVAGHLTYDNGGGTATISSSQAQGVAQQVQAVAGQEQKSANFNIERTGTYT